MMYFDFFTSCTLYSGILPDIDPVSYKINITYYDKRLYFKKYKSVYVQCGLNLASAFRMNIELHVNLLMLISPAFLCLNYFIWQNKMNRLCNPCATRLYSKMNRAFRLYEIFSSRFKEFSTHVVESILTMYIMVQRNVYFFEHVAIFLKLKYHYYSNLLKGCYYFYNLKSVEHCIIEIQIMLDYWMLMYTCS